MGFGKLVTDIYIDKIKNIEIGCVSMLDLIRDNIPEILRDSDNWVGFKVETKTPYDPNDFARLKKSNPQKEQFKAVLIL